MNKIQKLTLALSIISIGISLVTLIILLYK